ncbi:hypothetical protein [Pseudovibrio sp. Tun.PSC04-5.I4]|uniref:hypothetical protein n=1 Tax=Pseudovibrio sp. Tun.PSC04-5.I4 TaxID=1798213 RepID=UPI000886AD68|nr:hypothetical protein [Pseudovibrio sp. Tun.PSC04-5.I4]SDQ12402.1 hypothetical protein SAMN04515695_0036 [Pseudovibrio sp. Tun.PSC04-5.I4]
MNEQSISLPFHFKEDGEEEDVYDLLQAGVENGFTVSTYATPRQMEPDYDPTTEKLGPPLATYTAPTARTRLQATLRNVTEASALPVLKGGISWVSGQSRKMKLSIPVPR